MAVAEVVPERTASGEPVPTLLTDARKGRGRPKGRKTGTGTTGPAAKARKAKRETAPKRDKNLTRRELESAFRIGLTVIAGREQMDLFEVGAMFGLTDMTLSPDFPKLEPDDQDTIRASQDEAQKMLGAALEFIRGWCPPEDRLEAIEAQMVARGLALQSGKLNAARAQWAGPIARAVAPLMPYIRSALRESQTIAIVAAIAIPRLARRGRFNAIVARFIVGPLRMIGLGSKPKVNLKAAAGPEGEPAPVSSEPHGLDPDTIEDPDPDQ